jgi:SAM-dependent methyltransferase
MPKGLPDRFAPPETGYALYEGVEYRQFWEDPAAMRQDVLERHLISQFLPARGRRIIDVGCGYGRLAPLFLDRFDRSVLFDGSMSLLQDARGTVGDRALLVAGDVGRMPFKSGSFDCVLGIRVLQHVHELESALIEWHRIAAGGGTLVFSYHNKRNLRRILRYLEARRSGDPFDTGSAELMPTLLSHHPARMDRAVVSSNFSDPTYVGAVVFDALARITDRFGKDGPAGSAWAGVSGRLRLAPWLIGRATAMGDAPLIAGDRPEDVLCCPSCDADLTGSEEGLTCTVCGRTYPVVDGVYDFRVPLRA